MIFLIIIQNNTKYKKIIFGEPEAGLLREKRRSGLQEMLLSRTIK